MSISQGTRASMLDTTFPTSGAGHFIAYSTDGTSEAAIVERTAIGSSGWAAATSADPSVKANGTALTSAAATGSGTISHFAVFSAGTGGTQMTDWEALTASRSLQTGDTLSWAIGSLQVTLS